MFPPGDQGRVPVAICTGRGRNLVARILDGILCAAGISAGLMTKGGTFVAGEPADHEGAERHKVTPALLGDRRVEVLVRTVSPKDIARQGLLHETCAAAAVMDPRRKNEESRSGLDVAVRATQGLIAVEATSAMALESIRNVRPNRIILVSPDAGHPAVHRHMELGGKVMVVTHRGDQRIAELRQSKKDILSIPINEIPALADGQSRLKAHLFAVALAHGMGLNADEITSALRERALSH
jgi:hypothetical protein